MTLWRRLRSWSETTFRRSRMENEMDRELRFHIETLAEDLVRSGVSREEALRRARIEFGGQERSRRNAAKMWVPISYRRSFKIRATGCGCWARIQVSPPRRF